MNSFMRHPEASGQQGRVEAKSRRLANHALHALTFNCYHDGLPISTIDRILIQYGFDPLEEAIYCGRDGMVHEQVGARTWISLTWHKMESGRYEVVAYLS